MSQAVNDLTEESGTLFVVAAGNEGYLGDYSVSSPAVADHALAVANVDKGDVLDADSSVGPRVGDSALKPDIAAPGVDIVSALASEGWLGEPVDDLYATMTGTSMAAPHVAGAAALLLQADPDLDALDLKARLMGSSEGVGHTVWQEGAGRVDVPAALDATVIARTPSLSFGAVAYPPAEQEPITLPLVLANTGGDDVTLDLEATAAGPDGDPAPEGMITLSDTDVTVPAGESVSLEATLTPTAAGEATGLYSGVVLATTPDGATTRIPLGADLAPLTHTLTIEGITQDGEPSQHDEIVLVNLDEGSVVQDFPYFEDGEYVTEVVEGNYLVASSFMNEDDWAIVVEPDVTVTESTTVTLDARDTEPFTASTHRPSTSLDRGITLTTFLETSEDPEDFAVVSYGWTSVGLDGMTMSTNATGDTTPVGECAFDYTETRTGALGTQTSSLLPRLPYTYYLHETTPSMPVDTDIVADDSTLATVLTEHREMGDESTVVSGSWVPSGDTFSFGTGGWDHEFDAPGQRLEYLTGGLWWSKYTDVVTDDDWHYGGGLSSPILELEPGDQVDLPWNTQVYRPGLLDEEWFPSIAQFDGVLYVDLPYLVDGHGTASYSEAATSADFSLSRDGELLASGEYPSAEVEVGTEPAEFRMALDVEREADWWQRSTASRSEWTFTAGGEDADDMVVPSLLDVRIQPQRLDEFNRVTRTVDLDLRVLHPAQSESDAEVVDATLEWSAGGEWEPADLEEVEPGLYRTRLDLPIGTESVDLRVTAEDSDGATVLTEVEQALAVESSVSRSAGTNRYETAAAVARLHGFSDVVYLASGEQFPDALAVGGVAGALEAPVLLTQPDLLPAVTASALEDSGAREVRILGGTDAVEAGIAGELADLGYDVTRIGGADRYETAALLAGGVEPGGTVVVASGEVYADALAGGPVAAQDGRPVLLVQEGLLPAATATALGDLAPEQIVLLGGEARVDAGVEAALAEVAPVTRVAGADRYATAEFVGSMLLDVAPQGTGTAYLASGQDWPDALTLAARAGAEHDPVLLTKDTSLPDATASALVDLDVRRVVAAGESAAISDAVLDLVEDLLED